MRNALASRRGAARTGAWDLAENQAFRLIPGRDGVVIRVNSGCLVITQEGDPQDHVLLPGEDLRMSGIDAVVVWAMSPSSFVVTDAVAELLGKGDGDLASAAPETP